MSENTSGSGGSGGSGFVGFSVDHPLIPDELRADVARLLDRATIADAYIDALKERLDTLEAENKALRDRVAEMDTETKAARIATRRAYDAASRAADMRAAGDALARHVAEDTRGQASRQLVQAWEEASR